MQLNIEPTSWPCWQRRTFLVLIFVPGLFISLVHILMGACKGGFRVLAEIYEETCHAYRFLWARKTGFEPVIVEPDEHAHWWE